MTRKEFLDKYSKVSLSFHSYYKYTFTYKSDLGDGLSLSCIYGGDPDDIYKSPLGQEETLHSLGAGTATLYKDGNEVISTYF